jgi:prepilin-type N-terminal cleavage/methylation domain-containing protein
MRRDTRTTPRRAHAAAAGPAGGRAGFTLLEVLIAMVILGFVVLGAHAIMTDRMVRDLGRQETRMRANQLALDRIHALQSDPVYATLSARYGADESNIPNAPGFVRTTRFATTQLSVGNAYMTITVTVTHPRLQTPVTRTVVIASP